MHNLAECKTTGQQTVVSDPELVLQEALRVLERFLGGLLESSDHDAIPLVPRRKQL